MFRDAVTGALVSLALLTAVACGERGETEPAEPAETAATAPAPSAEPETVHLAVPHVLVLAIDTLRADRMSLYGAARDTTPNVDRIAAAGITMELAVSAAPSTWQSFVTILTGLYPLHHGVRFIFDVPLARDVVSLGGVLGAVGYERVGFDFDDFLFEMTGGGQGFDRVLDGRRTGHPTPDGVIADEVIAAMTGERQRPLFAFVRFKGPHWKYAPEPHFHDRYTKDGPDTDHSFNEGRFGTKATRGEGFSVVDPASYRKRYFDVSWSPETLAHMQAHYDGEIREIDATVGRLYDALEKKGLLRSTLLVITSDHGEEFGEHGYMQHGPRVDEHVLRVPLVIRFPDAAPRGKPGQRLAQLVRTADVMPTILDAIGLPVPPGLDGVSLMPAIDQGRDLELHAYAESGREFLGIDPELKLPGIAGKERMLRDRRWKIVYRHDGTRPTYRLYDLEADPGETRDVAAEHPEVAADLRARLEALMATDENPTKGDTAVGAEETEKLRQLGYVE
jgi:arylsulfatase A-like enzyme